MLIVNGALQGTAGFALASDPNMNAVLFDPVQPQGQRFSILNNTNVARMYHSEATLLPDGRVLISGSDPLDRRYPEEYRIEVMRTNSTLYWFSAEAFTQVYTPPYLAHGLAQPQFTLSINDWTYNGQYKINNVKLFQGTTALMRVSLIGGQ